MSLHNTRFPGESAAYRTARDELLAAEIELRRKIEDVAALRRKLPPGGAVPEDYVFDGPAGKVRLSELFQKPDASLVIYSYMYGPEMAQPCPMCTCMLDGLDGQAPHIQQRINLAVVAKSPLPRILAFTGPRGLAPPAALLVGGQQLQPRLSRRGRERRAEFLPQRLRPTRRRDAPHLRHRDGIRVERFPACIRAMSMRSGRCGTSSTSRRKGGGPTGTRSSLIADRAGARRSGCRSRSRRRDRP